MPQIELIGISGQGLSGEQWPKLRRCVAIVVSRRHRELVATLDRPLIDVAPVAAMLAEVEAALAKGDVAVLASGDPLLFGIGRRLVDHFGAERIRVHPALSAVQLACARFVVPWDDLVLISLHGRSDQTMAAQVLRHAKVMLFTDAVNSPDRIAATLLQTLTAYGDESRISALRIRVAENLGLADEKITSGSLEAIARRTFSPLNMMLIEQPPRQEAFTFGLGEHEISHSRGLITKDEVRASTLHRLRLPATGVLWDIGGGSGSVSLEAARLNPGLSIEIIEKKPEEQANIRANIRCYGAYNMHLTSGEAPEALAGLPAPDRIFVGGSGQRLEAILETAASRLASQGRIVVNAVLPQTEALAIDCLTRLGLQVESRTLTVTRRRYPGGEPQPFNPITLITGDK